ncbi:methylenetetrahydrofolate reductase [NAD(P)H] [Eisenibacter elegans]|uniref:methylenetetrahydrofolate reductase [NAD(P)H] n=1 Tax=Eisenibacter elegans TaxID=997 RepID=UPI00042097E1|nr:methylenetetrahydrofolate reductase [NAD(P)H] [Eisenibacter elegans]
MKIKDLFESHSKTFSFEFFPPKTFTATIDLGINVGQLMRLNPSFISVTYGAGGSTQTSSFDLLDYLQNKMGVISMAHYTCVGASREKIDEDMNYLYERDIHNLMLLRGDPPKGQEQFVHNPNGFNYGSDLVAYVSQQQRFCIGAGAYPEGHVEAANLAQDLQHLKLKVDAGADFLVTQMFFDNDYYFDFVAKARRLGIDVRIIPGIIPITNYSQIQRFAQLSGAKIPEHIHEALKPYQDQPEKIYQIGIDLAIQQSEDLLRRGAPGIHFYTLNKSTATVDIFASLDKKLTV